MNLLTLVRFKYSDLMTILKMCLRICLRFRYRTKGSIKGDGKRLCGDKRCIRENYSVLWPLFLGGVLCGLERSEKSLSVLNPRCSSAYLTSQLIIFFILHNFILVCSFPIYNSGIQMPILLSLLLFQCL